MHRVGKIRYFDSGYEDERRTHLLRAVVRYVSSQVEYKRIGPLSSGGIEGG